jgi:hypothetical protein
MSSALRAAREWRGGWVAPHLRRRVLAAMLAGVGVLLALSSLKPAPPPARAAAASPSADVLRGLRPGQVAAPVRLVDPGIAPLLHAGATVDVLAAPESPTGSADATRSPARVVASGVRVLAVTAPAASEPSLGTLVVLAVSRADAQALAGAEAGGRLSVTLAAA